MKTTLEGFYKLEVRGKDGKVRRCYEFHNIITDIGLNRLGTAGVLGACRIGTGTVAESAADTQLVSQSASTTTLQSSGGGAVSTAPQYGWRTEVYRFATGALNGNYSEIGVGWGTTGATLFSRALIKDGSGNPTTITVLSTETLDVTYELRLYAPQGDFTGTVNLGGVNYNWTARASGAGWSGANPPFAPRRWDPTSGFGSGANTNTDGSSSWYSGAGCALGPISGAITGSANSVSYDYNAALVGFSVLPYVDGSLQRDWGLSLTTIAGNLAGGIRAVVVNSNRGIWQVLFSASIPKDSNKVMALNFRTSWGRRP